MKECFKTTIVGGVPFLLPVITMMEAMGIVNSIGVGSAKAPRGADLGLPGGLRAG